MCTNKFSLIFNFWHPCENYGANRDFKFRVCTVEVHLTSIGCAFLYYTYNLECVETNCESSVQDVCALSHWIQRSGQKR